MLLREGQIIRLSAGDYRVVMVSECRAYCVPMKKTHRVIVDKLHDKEVGFDVTGRGINISPHAEVEIIADPDENSNATTPTHQQTIQEEDTQ